MNWDLLARCFLKTASGFKGKCNSEFFFLRQILMLRKLLGIVIIGQLVVRFLFVLSEFGCSSRIVD